MYLDKMEIEVKEQREKGIEIGKYLRLWQKSGVEPRDWRRIPKSGWGNGLSCTVHLDKMEIEAKEQIKKGGEIGK